MVPPRPDVVRSVAAPGRDRPRLSAMAVPSTTRSDQGIPPALADATPEQIRQFQLENGLLDPLPLRYIRFVADLVHGDLGTSVLTRAPVLDQVVTALPLTMQLTLLGLLIAVTLSVLFGVTAAIFRDRWPDQLIRIVSLVGVAAPAFWIALLSLSTVVLAVLLFIVLL